MESSLFLIPYSIRSANSIYILGQAQNGNQYGPKVKHLASGNVIVAYTGLDSNAQGVYFRILSPTLSGITDEIVANTQEFDHQNNPSIDVQTGGRFIITWRSWNEDGNGEGL